MSKATLVQFGQHMVPRTQIFYRTSLSLALVNLRPVVPVIPKRPALRFQDLTTAEVRDIFESAQHIGRVLESHFKASALTICIQDGAAAGQTVSHVHVHVLPRVSGDFNEPDDVYSVLDNPKLQRKNRTTEEMATESFSLRSLFPDNGDIPDEGPL